MDTWLHGWMLICSCFSASQTINGFLQFQSPALAHVSVGGSVELRCTFEQKVQYCFNAVLWQKLNLRTGQFMTVISPHENHVLGLDGNSCVLTLNNLTTKDSGLYVCISHFNSMAMIGNGSRVIVTRDDSRTVPELSIFYWSPEADSLSVQLQCLVLGVVPSQVRVFWMIGEKVLSGWTESAWTNDTDSATEFTRAHLAVPADEWTEAEEIQCCVEYKGQNFSKSLKQYERQAVHSWLLYAGCVAALLTIIVTIIISVGLHRDISVTRKSRGLTRKDAHRKISYGKQNSLKEDFPSVMGFSGDLISHEQDGSPSKE
ncbi:uncharacterized protein [Danio rerio]|uniref:Ig-like domain-containing protein n=3 Tax=Danio rerio TaxID=7955 RepID=A0A8M6YWK3_DANRE|nr:uncharacterized protein LOC101882070 [Danio rerio]|eukprot:XP_017207906.1 uncharacterized protein LOC101882070 [Danio rerio]